MFFEYIFKSYFNEHRAVMDPVRWLRIVDLVGVTIAVVGE